MSTKESTSYSYRDLNDQTDIIKFHLGDAYTKFVFTIQVQYLTQKKKD